MIPFLFPNASGPFNHTFGIGGQAQQDRPIAPFSSLGGIFIYGYQWLFGNFAFNSTSINKLLANDFGFDFPIPLLPIPLHLPASSSSSSSSPPPPPTHATTTQQPAKSPTRLLTKQPSKSPVISPTKSPIKSPTSSPTCSPTTTSPIRVATMMSPVPPHHHILCNKISNFCSGKEWIILSASLTAAISKRK
jgi:hypothetical protein